MSQEQESPARPPVVTYPVAIIVVAVLAAVVVVAIFAQSQTAILMMFGTTILGGIGYTAARVVEAKSETKAVKEQTNGNTTAMLKMLEAQGRMLAAAHPISPQAMAAAIAEPAPALAAEIGAEET